MERDAYPSPLNYYNFPKSVCTSVNESICHGIPDMRELRDGDIVNIDVSTYVRGFHGDLNEVCFLSFWIFSRGMGDDDVGCVLDGRRGVCTSTSSIVS